jgi:hypothetical protein
LASSALLKSSLNLTRILSANDNPHTIAGSHRQIKMQYR